MLKIVFITNEAAPYRVPVLNKLAAREGVHLQVVFCCSREPNRLWDLPPFEFDHVFLRDSYLTIRGRYIHYNPDILRVLRRLDPDVVITDGYNPTHLFAFAYALATRKPRVVMTDGTLVFEQGLTRIHRSVRRFVFNRAHAFVAASIGGRQLYESYGVDSQLCFKSCLCTDNDAYRIPAGEVPKKHDFIFCGRIEKLKNPMFALEVAHETARKLNRKVSILFVGSGSEEENVRKEAAAIADLVDVEFNGFAAQADLPRLYPSARIFLFPTLIDAWGVVANEACAAGLPVIVSPVAGVANELVLDGENGYVRTLDVAKWASCAAELLDSPEMYERFSRRSLEIVSEYTFEHAASGMLDACLVAQAKVNPGSARPVVQKAPDSSNSQRTASHYSWGKTSTDP